MATIVLSAVGFSAGASIGGTVLGLSSAIVGRAVGATIGRKVDQFLLGAGSAAVETGRVDRFRLTGASEGTALNQVYGRMRVPGHVIWATQFQEDSTTTGGKGSPTPKTTTYNYSVSMAVALCEGVISRVGRVWADGVEVARDDLNMRVYTGTDDQLPDSKIEAIEGVDAAPAYRGTAYVVFEDLALGQFGNRVPQFTFEVFRPAQEEILDGATDMVHATQGVALIPGTGEYGLATTPVHYTEGAGVSWSANVNSPSGKTDFSSSMEALREELPQAKSVSLVVSWFGDDLRADQCTLKPKVEQNTHDGVGMPWSVSGETRATSELVPTSGDRAVYGGTPTDQSVIEAIEDMNSSGQSVVFYPFILMEQLDGNTLVDPYSGEVGQSVLPWRGRITTSLAPNVDGTTDGTAAASAEVDAFFGTASVGDFTSTETGVSYTGPAEWSYRRFILHYAHLCAAAGGVDAFCIGSEMRGLTQIRDDAGFPAVAKLVELAADVRAILGSETKIGYAADWTEYFGYQPQDGSGDRLFHLDPLWADANIDFIGIDNYMPMSDWREGDDHLDADWGEIYNLDYLQSNIEGGEGYDWYYHSDEAREAQIRTDITDGDHDEPWIYRYKDIRNWWNNAHHERIGGVRQAVSTDWVAGSKPIWFTEIGCAAINKGTNQPNKFLDPKSSESSLPRYSTGARDDLIQQQYLRAIYDYWAQDGNNPVNEDTGVQMLDMARAHVWAWDARPFPFFPNNVELWSDGDNYTRGHWINGRTAARSLASVVAEICERSGVSDYDVSGLYGLVRGYTVSDHDGARSALQPLMLAYGFDAIERDGVLIFRNRDGKLDTVLDTDTLAITSEQGSAVQTNRAPDAEIAGRVRLNFVEAEGDYEIRAAEAIFPDEANASVAQTELSLAFSTAEARTITERWLAESRIARDGIKFTLPPSSYGVGAGDVVEVPDSSGSSYYRIDHVEQAGVQIAEALRIEPSVYTPSDAVEDLATVSSFTAPVPVFSQFMDLPLITGDEDEIAPHIAATGTPWPGSVAVYSALEDAGYDLNTLVGRRAIIGTTETPMAAAVAGVWDRGAVLRVKLSYGALSSASEAAVLAGANMCMIGDGSSDNWEVFQFVNADLVDDNTYDLSLRLRGQAGSDGIMPDTWPIGSTFVLFDGAPEQITLATSARGSARHYRIGSSSLAYTDSSYEHKVEAFQGIGLRPYAPVHLRAALTGSGDTHVTWVRRTRIDGDVWDGIDVPLGETTEQYILRVMDGTSVVREETVSSPEYTYTAAAQASDGISGAYAIEIAQVSERFGAGIYRRIEINV